MFSVEITEEYLSWQSSLSQKQRLRVYLARIEEKKFVLLWGGNKNGQSRDIKKAQKLLCWQAFQ
jgi:putative component of toxin-antitoxin plasmid stabilization module